MSDTIPLFLKNYCSEHRPLDLYPYAFNTKDILECISAFGETYPKPKDYSDDILTVVYMSGAADAKTTIRTQAARIKALEASLESLGEVQSND